MIFVVVMLKRNSIIAVSLTALGVVGACFLFKHLPAGQLAPHRQATSPQTAPAPTLPPARMAAVPTPEMVPPAPTTALLNKANRQPAPVKSVRAAQPPHPPDRDPDARAALRFVGADPDADVYWSSAINDPDLPAAERRNLIEDLNEDGLSNPDHPSTEDRPLILHRIEMIEALAPYAMDQVNFEAFTEAYKDLSKMLADTGG